MPAHLQTTCTLSIRCFVCFIKCFYPHELLVFELWHSPNLLPWYNTSSLIKKKEREENKRRQWLQTQLITDQLPVITSDQRWSMKQWFLIIFRLTFLHLPNGSPGTKYLPWAKKEEKRMKGEGLKLLTVITNRADQLSVITTSWSELRLWTTHRPSRCNLSRRWFGRGLQ